MNAREEYARAKAAFLSKQATIKIKCRTGLEVEARRPDPIEMIRFWVLADLDLGRSQQKDVEVAGAKMIASVDAAMDWIATEYIIRPRILSSGANPDSDKDALLAKDLALADKFTIVGEVIASIAGASAIKIHDFTFPSPAMVG